MNAARAMCLSPDSGFTSGGGLAGGGGSKPSLVSAPVINGGIGAEEVRPKIQQFGQGMGAKNREDVWKRKPSVTGRGATHVKSFHCKLADDSLAFMDQQINAWLDEHPEIEVKFVTTGIGEWQGKVKEPGLVVNVWI